MRPSDVFAYFGVDKHGYAELARKLGLSRSAVHGWKRMTLMPPLQAAKIHKLTNGALQFDPANYSEWGTGVNKREEPGPSS